jgi:predicted branched-subunit amino acid permease
MNNRANAVPTARSEVEAGVKSLLPILLGIVPFGLISGIAVVQTHIPPAGGLVMSLLIFSGAALIVALQLITSGAPALVVIFSALVINLRFMIYSASLAPLLKGLSAWRKSLLGYLLSDQAYAASITHMTESSFPEVAWMHFLGSGLTMWLAWQISVGIGMFIAAAFRVGRSSLRSLDLSRPGSAIHQGPLHLAVALIADVAVLASRRPSTADW